MMKNLQILLILLPILFLCVSFSNCAGSRTSKTTKLFEKNPPFSIKEAYFQKWVAGIKEGGSGVEVHLIMETMEPNVEIQNIYFRNHILEAQKSLDNSNEYVAHLSSNLKNDVVMDIDPMKEAQNIPSQEFPFELKENEAVVSYWFKGKKKYFKISNISEKERIAYPQSNPNNRN